MRIEKKFVSNPREDAFRSSVDEFVNGLVNAMIFGAGMADTAGTMEFHNNTNPEPEIHVESVRILSKEEVEILEATGQLKEV